MNSKKLSNQSSKEKPFVATRAHHLNETAEDYTELVADLINAKGEARICDIARSLGISHVTALRSVKRLQRDGYLVTLPHQPVQLTKKGEHLAAFAKKRHILLLQFLKRLGVPEKEAAIDVEGMEHHISESTLHAMEKHLKFLEDIEKAKKLSF